ncbi:helix-turn-helix protein [compost metagenome]
MRFTFHCQMKGEAKEKAKGGAKIGSKNRRNEAAILILATNLKRIRLEKGLTIHQLANKLEMDYSQISRMERMIVNPSVSMIFDIAHVLGVAPSDLIK